jgi:hypothetical protein
MGSSLLLVNTEKRTGPLSPGGAAGMYQPVRSSL